MRSGMVGLGGSCGGSWGEVGQGVAVAVRSMTDCITNVSLPVKGGSASAGRWRGWLCQGLRCGIGAWGFGVRWRDRGSLCPAARGGRAARPVQVHGVFLAVTIGLPGGRVRQAGKQEFGTTDAHRWTPMGQGPPLRRGSPGADVSLFAVNGHAGLGAVGVHRWFHSLAFLPAALSRAEVPRVVRRWALGTHRPGRVVSPLPAPPPDKPSARISWSR